MPTRVDCKVYERISRRVSGDPSSFLTVPGVSGGISASQSRASTGTSSGAAAWRLLRRCSAIAAASSRAGTGSVVPTECPSRLERAAALAASLIQLVAALRAGHEFRVFRRGRSACLAPDRHPYFPARRLAQYERVGLDADQHT